MAGFDQCLDVYVNRTAVWVLHMLEVRRSIRRCTEGGRERGWSG